MAIRYFYLSFILVIRVDSERNKQVDPRSLEFIDQMMLLRKSA